MPYLHDMVNNHKATMKLKKIKLNLENGKFSYAYM